MKTFRFQLKDKEIKCTIPESWEELTVKQAQDLNLKTYKGEPLEVIAALSGQDMEALRDVYIDVKHYDMLEACVVFLSSPSPDLLTAKHKPQVTVMGKTIEVPKDLLKESIGQFTYFQQFADSDNALSMCMAIYLQPLIDGKLGEVEDIEKVADHIEGMLFVEVFPVINFFFQMLSAYRIYGVKGLKEYRKRVNKEKMNFYTNQ